jgi:hypothetical protein
MRRAKSSLTPEAPLPAIRARASRSDHKLFIVTPSRRALYLAAFIASRHDPQLRAFRQRRQAAGKCFKAAIIATARKLLTNLNAVIADNRDYELRSPA